MSYHVEIRGRVSASQQNADTLTSFPGVPIAWDVPLDFIDGDSGVTVSPDGKTITLAAGIYQIQANAMAEASSDFVGEVVNHVNATTADSNSALQWAEQSRSTITAANSTGIADLTMTLNVPTFFAAEGDNFQIMLARSSGVPGSATIGNSVLNIVRLA